MISGSLVALVTPMDSGGGLDWKALERLIDFHLEKGTDGIVAVGTSGESATLDMAEHKYPMAIHKSKRARSAHADDNLKEADKAAIPGNQLANALEPEKKEGEV